VLVVTFGMHIALYGVKLKHGGQNEKKVSNHNNNSSDNLGCSDNIFRTA